MSQPAICNKCKDAGFPHEMIKFEKNGTKPDGSIKWKPLNPDGSEHKHKENTLQGKIEETKQNIGNMMGADGMKDLAAAIRELTATIRSRPL